jgi:Ni,Fe-hydrogenase III small subunit/Pyruvate/2-oxoacid:ferredoxin oxidoreductase delta subunit
MIQSMLARFKQRYRTVAYPKAAPKLPERFRGLPKLDAARCASGCGACADVCPTGAIVAGAGLSIDMGKCLFCTACTTACPSGAVSFTGDHRLCSRSRKGLTVGADGFAPAAVVKDKIQKLFGRSLKLRQVSAGGCNACEADINVLGTVVFDLGRFGIQVVASPRHADGIMVTGPVTENMRIGLLKTYDAVPDPRIVIACGSCAISGGPFASNQQQHNGLDSFMPVDLYIPGCPPSPYTILDGLLRLIGKLEPTSRAPGTPSA